ncbi:ribbon-helix-helix protein, CopG family [Candidatus Woesearchaeota archaeon]|nr:ribbon-helix-helix protein, CopG family [Candidatus Woesearchaeota archaeon]
MESITIKVEENLAKEIDKAMKPYYSTKTEFIREAIREKLMLLRKGQAMEELGKHFGKAKAKTGYDEERQIREKVGREFAKKFGIRL